MKRSQLYRIQILFSITALLAFFQNCSNTDYKVGPINDKVSSGVIGDKQPNDIIIDDNQIDDNQIEDTEISQPIIIDEHPEVVSVPAVENPNVVVPNPSMETPVVVTPPVVVVPPVVVSPSTPPVVVTPPLVSTTPPPIVVPEDIKDENVICDPFSNGENKAQSKSGIKADLYYLESSSLPRNYFQDIVKNGVHSDKVIMMNDINVPTRNFTEGFLSQSNEILKKSNGENLIEWFALSMTGKLQLGPNDAPGDYQLATLADDGAILYIDSGDNNHRMKNLINDDGHHATKLGCGMEPVRLESGKKVNFKLDYFQGPRTQIAMILLYRPYNVKNAADPLCGVANWTGYFDSSTSPSTAKANYKKLLANGWKPLTPAHFALPEEVKVNPCAAQ